MRRALGLAINRYDMSKTLKPLSGLETLGGLVHPDTPWGLKQAGRVATALMPDSA